MTEKRRAALQRVKQMFSSGAKIDQAKKEYRKRKAREYQNENRERYSVLHRNYYRKKAGIPLDAPVMTPAEAAAKARKVQQQKREAKP